MKRTTLDDKDLSSFCMELHLMLDSGLSPAEGLPLLADDEQDPTRKALLHALCRSMQEGTSLSETFRQAEVFPPYLVEIIDIGLRTGNLDRALLSLAEYYQRQAALARAVRSAVLWPLLLLVMLLVVISVLVTAVLPVFQDVFQQLGVTLSPAAALFLSVGQGLHRYRWPLLMGLLVIVLSALLVIFLPACRQRCIRFIGRRFSATKTGMLVGQARMSAALTMAISSGMDLDEALELAQRLTAGMTISRQAADCRAKMTQDQLGFAEAVSETGLFDALSCRLLSVGARTGSADRVMAEIARRTQTGADEALEQMVGRIEPALITVLSVLVGVVLLSVMLPLLSVMSTLA